MADPTNPNMLLDEIRKSMTEMQQQMQTTYLGLENMEVSGESEGIIIKITCTYKFVDIIIKPEAMKGGIKEFTYRIRDAWSRATEAVQKATQSKTMELLQNMQIPDEIRSMSIDQAKLLEGEDDRRRSGG